MPLPPSPPARGVTAADLLLPTPDSPLRGLTVLVVEDSRFAAEALRLVCRRTGARLRRADTLQAARRHLRAYRPDIVLVDLGLPDGRGEGLIAQLAAMAPRPVILATSGDPAAGPAACAAGATAFLDKPMAGVAGFLSAVLPHLPDRARLAGLCAPAAGPLAPDPLALRDDLAHAARLLDRAAPDTGFDRAGSGHAGADLAGADHAAGFVQGVARSAGDPALEAAAHAARRDPARLPALRRAVRHRLALCPPDLAP